MRSEKKVEWKQVRKKRCQYISRFGIFYQPGSLAMTVIPSGQHNRSILNAWTNLITQTDITQYSVLVTYFLVLNSRVTSLIEVTLELSIWKL